MRLLYLFFFSLILLFVGCRSSQIISPESSQPPAYSIIYVIHGDANYLYHNADGKELQADEQVLKQAKEVARSATNGEVFIFHQRPEKKILWLFPKKDRAFRYYRNGKLVVNQRYSPQPGIKAMKREVQLYSRYHKSVKSSKTQERILLYFGHEVPSNSGPVYHISRPAAKFNTQLFADGIKAFSDIAEASFDLTVLSTCNNGTPGMIHALAPSTNYVLASPQNLHLSHIDTAPLSLLDKRGQNKITTAQMADSLAVKTYNRLTSFLQTVVTLTRYNTSLTNSYLNFFDQSYQTYLADQAETEIPKDNMDCAELSFFDRSFKKGLKVWYKAPRFGQKKQSQTYSGWGCQKAD